MTLKIADKEITISPYAKDLLGTEYALFVDLLAKFMDSLNVQWAYVSKNGGSIEITLGNVGSWKNVKWRL